MDSPPPKGATLVRFTRDEELFGVWRTRRQAKKCVEKKTKEKEAGEERKDYKDEDAKDGDGSSRAEPGELQCSTRCFR